MSKDNRFRTLEPESIGKRENNSKSILGEAEICFRNPTASNIRLFGQILRDFASSKKDFAIGRLCARAYVEIKSFLDNLPRDLGNDVKYDDFVIKIYEMLLDNMKMAVFDPTIKHTYEEWCNFYNEIANIIFINPKNLSVMKFTRRPLRSMVDHDSFLHELSGSAVNPLQVRYYSIVKLQIEKFLRENNQDLDID